MIIIHWDKAQFKYSVQFKILRVSKSPHCSLGACGQGAWMLVMKIDGKKVIKYNDDDVLTAPQ